MMKVVYFGFGLYSIIVSVYGQCDKEWMLFDNACYLFSDTEADWFGAEFACESLLGGYLVEVNSERENTFLKNEAFSKHMQNPSQGNIGYYIGGSDMSTEGNFIWMHSRQPFNYTDWKQGMPDSHGNHEDCVHLYPLFHFQWNDIQCSTPGYFICEKPMNGN